MIKLNKRENKENTKHKPPIPAADLQKLKSSDTIWGDKGKEKLIYRRKLIKSC